MCLSGAGSDDGDGFRGDMGLLRDGGADDMSVNVLVYQG